VLKYQIDTGLRSRLGIAPSNFEQVLTPPDSDLAQAMVKDPLIFQHLGLTKTATEYAVEEAQTNRTQDTLLELGRGMAFVGRQVRLTAGRTDQWVDLLMFHTEQLRYVVIELKVGDFEISFVSQLGTYVVMVDDLLRNPEIHAPTVGILLCQGKDEAIVRYTLASSAASMAVAERLLRRSSRIGTPL